jgi:hypothetical protein
LVKDSFDKIPLGTTHYFKITSKEPCKALNVYAPRGFEKSIICNVKKAKTLTLPPEDLVYQGSRDKSDMHISVNIQQSIFIGDFK